MRKVNWLIAASLMVTATACVETTSYGGYPSGSYGYGYNSGYYNTGGYSYGSSPSRYYGGSSGYASNPRRYGPNGDYDRDGIPNKYDRDANGDGIPDRYQR